MEKLKPDALSTPKLNANKQRGGKRSKFATWTMTKPGWLLEDLESQEKRRFRGEDRNLEKPRIVMPAIDPIRGSAAARESEALEARSQSPNLQEWGVEEATY